MGVHMLSRVSLSFAAALVMLMAAPAAADMSTLDEELRLKTAITIQSNVVTLGDVFDGYLARPEKVVTQAPKPGQRMVLSAEWLTATARTYGLNWQPSTPFDRAIVYQPGQTVTSGDIVAAVKAALINNGMPAGFDISASSPQAPVTVSMNALKGAVVREVQYDAAAKQFSAVVQIPPNDPAAVFIQVRGVAFATVQVPVLKQALGKNTTISADMIDLVAMAQDKVTPAIITDPDQLIGKTPRMFLKAGEPLRDNQLTQIVLVQIPVLIDGMDRDGRIDETHVKMVEVNAAAVPLDAVTDAAFLIGKTPRRPLVAGAPIRRADVALMRQVEVPVATRDLPHGTAITDDDVTWVMVNASEAMNGVATSPEELLGQATRYLVRAGQQLRLNSIAKDIAVKRGQVLTVLWSVQNINLTASGSALENGAVGDVIRVTNSKSKQAFLAEVIDGRTVRVAAPEQVAAR